MLDEVFYWLLNMSIIASAFGILIYSTRFIKGFPKSGSYILWGVVFFRLLCPIGISSKFSLLNIISKVLDNSFIKTITVYKVAENTPNTPHISTSNMIQAAASYHPFTYKTNILEGFFNTAAVLWAIVSMAALLSVIIMYVLAKSELKKATHIYSNIYEGTMVNTPTVYGIIKPKIVLPVGVDKEQLQYILAHENVHIRRRDNIWRMLVIFAACLHWFNPLIWLFVKSFINDCELSCDEAAIKKMNIKERKKYAVTLLTYGTKDKIVFASAFGSSKVKVRIEHVLSFKKLTVFSTISFMIMLIVIASILLTNARV